MATHHLAQVNIARALAPLDSPTMAGFVARIAELNALAEGSPGFVWRFQDGSGAATYTRPFDDDRILFNMSVWETIEHLYAYAYKSGHAEVFRSRKDWFERLPSAAVALWWIPAGDVPTVEDGVARLAHLEQHGPTPKAFTFKTPFPPEGASESKEAASVRGVSPPAAADSRPVRVRPFAEADCGQLEALWSRAFPNDPARNAPALVIAQKRQVQPELLLVAEVGDLLVGAVIAGYDGVRGWIYHLAVDGPWRRRGIATALVRRAEEALTALGCPKVNLQVRASNAEVVPFYRQLGYEVQDLVSMGRVLGKKGGPGPQGLP
jgi:ribosomal protein S18 acetylase RimI-like enzyme